MKCSIRFILLFFILMICFSIHSFAGEHKALCSEQKSSINDLHQILNKLTSTTTLDSTLLNYDVLQYDINLIIDEISEYIIGDVTFYVEIMEENTTDLRFELYANMGIDSVKNDGGAGILFSRFGNLVTLNLDKSYGQGEQLSFVVYYQGSPEDLDRYGFFFDSYHTIPIMGSQSQPFFSHSWWPCKDRIYDKADSMRISVTASSDLIVSSNGVLDSIVPNGNGTNTTFWRELYPITPSLFTVNASIYHLWIDEWIYNGGSDTTPIYNYILESFYEMSLDSLAKVPQLLSWMSSYYRTYPFAEEKYGHSMFGNSAWALEHQNNVSLAAGSHGLVDYLIVHEMAHMWWGDAITCKSWGHTWINEGWATYSEALIEFERGNWYTYHFKMQEFNDPYWWGRTSIYPDDTTDAGDIFDAIIYYKGAWVAHMLRRYIGDENFFGAIDSLFNSEYLYGFIDTDEFADFFSAYSGHDLTEFFNDWIYGDYWPNYHYSYTQHENDSGWYDIYIAVDQVQTTQPLVFDNMIDFGIMFDGGSVMDTVQFLNTKREQVYLINSEDSITILEIDPGDWLINYASPVTWSFRILTEQSDIASATRYKPYYDTIFNAWSTNTTIYILQGGLPEGINIHNSGIISGSTIDDPGDYWFKIQFIDNYTGQYQIKEYTITVLEGQGVAGDVDGNNQLDVSDLLYMVDHFFADPPGPPPSNPVLADVNADCQVDISDLLYLVDFFFAEPTGPAPQVGCI